MKPLVEETAAVIRDRFAAGHIAEVDPPHRIFSIWALTQHNSDFDVEVRTILGVEGEDLFPEAERHPTTLFGRLPAPT